MKGKAGLVIGLAVGYVLGTRAGRERYEQIKEQALKVWNLDPVQEQVGKVKDFAAVDRHGAAEHAVGLRGQGHARRRPSKGTPGQKLDAAIKTGKDQADDVAAAAETSADAVKDAASTTPSTTSRRPRRSRGGA